MKNDIDSFERSIDELPRAERHVLTRRVLGDALREIGSDQGYSPEWTRQLEARARKRLTTAAKSRKS